MDSAQDQSKNDKFDVAIADMTTMLGDMADMYQKIKKIKFNYLIQTCDIYTKVDYPSIMMDVCDKEIKQMIPPAENIRKMNF